MKICEFDVALDFDTPVEEKAQSPDLDYAEPKMLSRFRPRDQSGTMKTTALAIRLDTTGNSPEGARAQLDAEGLMPGNCSELADVWKQNMDREQFKACLPIAAIDEIIHRAEDNRRMPLLSLGKHGWSLGTVFSDQGALDKCWILAFRRK